MFCQYCGKKLPDGEACACRQNAQRQEPQQQPQQQAPPSYAGSDNRKIYSILSYIGPLWLIGLLAPPEKDDPGVRFHVGQGMMITICMVGLSIIWGILTPISGLLSFSSPMFVFNPLWFVVSGLISFGIWGGGIALSIIGAIGANNGQQKQLPVIGYLAFYK